MCWSVLSARRSQCMADLINYHDRAFVIDQMVFQTLSASRLTVDTNTSFHCQRFYYCLGHIFACSRIAYN